MIIMVDLGPILFLNLLWLIFWALEGSMRSHSKQTAGFIYSTDCRAGW